jgi:hypothetical protein
MANASAAAAAALPKRERGRWVEGCAQEASRRASRALARSNAGARKKNPCHSIALNGGAKIGVDAAAKLVLAAPLARASPVMSDACEPQHAGSRYQGLRSATSTRARSARGALDVPAASLGKARARTTVGTHDHGFATCCPQGVERGCPQPVDELGCGKAVGLQGLDPPSIRAQIG